MSGTTVDIYTDGACSGNPGPGGWGAILRHGESEREILGGEADTTNNRMELMAAIRALEALKRPVTARVHTDSTYVKDGITKWIVQWKARDWRTAARESHRVTEQVGEERNRVVRDWFLDALAEEPEFVDPKAR